MNARALSLTCEDAAALTAAWMPLFENGGLFVPTETHYRLGQRVYLLLKLPYEEERRPISGLVAWVSPLGMTGRRPAGIGVHLDAEEKGVRQRIEYLLNAISVQQAEVQSASSMV